MHKNGAMRDCHMKDDDMINKKCLRLHSPRMMENLEFKDVPIG